MKSPRSMALALALGAIGTAGAIGAATPAQAATLISTSYEHSNFGGARLNHTHPTDGFACTDSTNDVDTSDSSFSSSWDNRISSFRAFSNCGIKVYDFASFGGSSTPFYDQERSNLGLMDNAASSYRWS